MGGGFGGYQRILERMNDTVGNVPRTPWDERLPDRSSPNNPGVRPPVVIEPQDDSDLPFNGRRITDQIDASQMAGPVPTNLSGDQPFDYTQILNRGVGDSGQPQMDTSPTFDYRKVLDGAKPTGFAGLPSQAQTPINETWQGVRAPALSDPKYQEMGRGASARAAFTEGKKTGGLIGGALSALIGVLDKDSGRQSAYNTDAARWYNTKDAQLGIERADPVLARRLAVGQMEEEEPFKEKLYDYQQDRQQERQTALENTRAANRKAQIDQTASNALTKLGADFQNKLFLQNNSFKQKANQEMRQIAAGFAGNPQFDAMTDPEKADFISDRWQEQRQQKLDESVSRETKNEEQRLLAQERREHPEKFRTPVAGTKGITPNYQMHLRLKPIEDEQRTNQAAINLWNKKLAAGEITEDEHKAKTAPLNAKKDVLATKWAQEAAAQKLSDAPPAKHPNIGKTFTLGGKQYIADEIDADGNITKYHEK